jgi:hypothetical protein
MKLFVAWCKEGPGGGLIVATTREEQRGNNW